MIVICLFSSMSRSGKTPPKGTPGDCHSSCSSQLHDFFFGPPQVAPTLSPVDVLIMYDRGTISSTSLDFTPVGLSDF